MSVSEFTVTPRTTTGKCPGRRLRREGQAPAVIYGGDAESELVSIVNHDLEVLLAGSGSDTPVLNLTVEGSKGEQPAMVRELQRDPVNGRLLHVDFLRVRLDQVMEFDVPLEPLGVPVGVTEGGVLEYVQQSVRVRCLPTEVPQGIAVDVSRLNIRESIQIKDIEAPEGAELVGDPDQPVFSVLAPRKVEEVVEGKEEDVVEGADGEPEVVGEKKAEGAGG